MSCSGSCDGWHGVHLDNIWIRISLNQSKLANQPEYAEYHANVLRSPHDTASSVNLLGFAISATYPEHHVKVQALFGCRTQGPYD